MAAVRMPDRFARWARERELSGDQRAGAWARGQVHRRNWAFVRRNWRRISLIAILTVALVPLTLLMPSWSRMFVAGALVATGVCMTSTWVLVASGSACLMMGEVAEQWTARELRPFRRRGWKLINRMLIKRWDIDHIGVGAPGVLVVETKWRAESWELERPDDRLFAAVQQVHDNEGDVRRFLGTAFVAPIRSVVVLWSAQPLPDRPRVIGDVAVVPGPSLSRWIESIEGEALGASDVLTVWRKLDRHVARRDAYELERNGPSARGMADYIWQGWNVLVGVIVGMLASVALLVLLGPLFGLFATATLLLGIGCAALRSQKLRAAALGWLGSTQFVTVAVLGAVVVSSLR